MAAWLFLVAYTCSGLAGLVYEVSWTRMLTLEMGRGVAASSTVLAAFMGGLALGAVLAGRWASTLSARQALRAYAGLEVGVAALAVALPFALRALTPLFAAAYRDGSSGITFGLVRLIVSLGLLGLPALALGATFPIAIRWFASERERGDRLAGRLYAANTAGAATGALLAGFVLLPAMGILGTLVVGAVGSLLAAAIAAGISVRAGFDGPQRVRAEPARASASGRRSRRSSMTGGSGAEAAVAGDDEAQPGVAAMLLAVTGLATFSAEVAWTRVFALLLGPSTYAFAATVVAFVVGSAIGALLASVASLWLPRRAALAAAFCLAAASAAAFWAAGAAGTSMPQTLARAFASGPSVSIAVRALRASLVVLPMALAIGAAFPLALQLASDEEASPRTLGWVYAVNTVAGVVGSLLTGFVLIPRLGLERTLTVSAALLAAGALLAVVRARGSLVARAVGLMPLVVAAIIVMSRGPWDRDLLASGAYKYAPAIAPGLDVQSALTFGRLIYYRDGAMATVSVRALTGTLSLAIDGKVDASTGGDMLTQKLLAHVPLLVHGHAKHVSIIGLGSGITAASALAHDIDDLDVIEISPEVAEASRLFAAGGRSPLDDPRVRLLLEDGRTHLALTRRTYDVIIAEPSNPWMAGVAALFTQEYFASARARLSDQGVLCQWINTYDISLDDLRSVVATFTRVFPHATLWLAGDGDLLMVGSAEPIEPRLASVAARAKAPAVAADLAASGVASPFVLLSMFIGGERATSQFGGSATLQTDDRMALEFSAPRALHSVAPRDNVSALHALDQASERPPAITRAWADATGADLAHRSAVLRRAGAFEAAYEAAAHAVGRDPGDPDALQSLVDASAPLSRQRDAAGLLRSAVTQRPDTVEPRIALSRLQASTGAVEPAIAAVGEWLALHEDDPAAVEQLASIFADMGDADRLGTAVSILERHPERAGSAYYAAALHFMRQELEPAAAAAERALVLDARMSRAHNLRGAIHATRGDSAAARRSFEAALALDARDPATYQNLATLEMNAGHADTAVRLFGEALSLDPTSVAARQGLERARAVH